MKILIDFFRARSSVPTSRLLWMGTVAGVSNALVLAIINAGADNAAHGTALGWLLAIFIVTELVFVWSQRYLLAMVFSEVEKIIHAYRLRQVERVRHCDLDALERIGSARIFGALTRHTRVISTAASAIAMGAQSVVVVSFALIYLGWLNIPALLLAVAVLGLGTLVYAARMKRARASLAESAAKENELFNSITDLLDGFKEIRLNVRRSADVAVFIEAISRRVLELSTEVGVKLSEIFVLTHFVFFGAAAAVVFLLPGIGFIQSEELLKVVTVIIFLIGPMLGLSGAAPAVANASASCEILIDLERQLEEAARSSRSTPEALSRFDRLELGGVVYRHTLADGSAGFQVGPIDLTLRKGELLFISGGNGSGKSTVLRLITALYMPQEGQLTVDGEVIGADRREAYQSLFSTVFSDFHLFEWTFGLGGVAPERVAEWLAMMEIGDKTGLHNGRFDTIKLSTGQRKRLALAVAVLEDRPICVFDEFAADQDPVFRRKFYDEILPLLRRNGKTVVVVTHDERYFERADRHLTMLDGRFVERGAGHV